MNGQGLSLAVFPKNSKAISRACRHVMGRPIRSPRSRMARIIAGEGSEPPVMGMLAQCVFLVVVCYKYSCRCDDVPTERRCRGIEFLLGDGDLFH